MATDLPDSDNAGQQDHITSSAACPDCGCVGGDDCEHTACGCWTPKQPSTSAACPDCGCVGGDDCEHTACGCWTPKQPSTSAATDEWELAKAVLYAMRQVAHGNGIGYCVDRYLPEPLRSDILVQAGQEPFNATR